MGKEFQPFDIAEPFTFYAKARREEPVFYSEALDFWIVTRFEDIKAIFKDPATFFAENTQAPFKPRPPEVKEVFEKGGFTAYSGLSARVPPDHTRLKAFISKAFTPKRVAALEPRIRALAVKMIEDFKSKGKADWVAELAYELPALVIFMLLGIPDEDVPNVKVWAQSRVFLNFGDLPVNEQIEHAHNLVKYWNYCVALVESRFTNPGDDLPSDLVRLYKEGDQTLSKHEIASLVYGQLTAGHETTTNLLGNGLKELLTDRSQWETICNNPALIPGAVEELLRYGPSVFAWKRKVKKATKIADVDIPEGANLLLLLGSANRDEAHFHEPETLDVQRDNAKDHLAFGLGIHYCLGAPLARLEAKIVLEELCKRLPHLHLVKDQTFHFVPNTTFRGPSEVWLEWDVSQNPEVNL
jgi:cytochrome P450